MIFLLRWLIRRLAARRAARPAKRRPPSLGEGPIGLVAHQARYDLLGILRDRQARFFTLLLPLLFLVIFVSTSGNDTVGPHHVKASTYYVPGLGAMAVIASSFVNLVIAITAQRETGILKRRRATPVPAWVLIAGRTATALSMSTLVLVVLLVVGRLAYGVQLRLAAVPAVALVAVAGAITFCVLGYALSTLIGSAEAAQPMVQTIMLPLYFLSGVFIPNPNLPSWLQRVGEVFPVEPLVHGLRAGFDPVAGGTAISSSDLAVLGAWTAGGLLLALRRFRWTPAASPD